MVSLITTRTTNHETGTIVTILKDKFCFKNLSQNSAAAFFAERVIALTREAFDEDVAVLQRLAVLDDLGDALGDGQTLQRALGAQLLQQPPLCLHVLLLLHGHVAHGVAGLKT